MATQAMQETHRGPEQRFLFLFLYDWYSRLSQFSGHTDETFSFRRRARRDSQVLLIQTDGTQGVPLDNVGFYGNRCSSDLPEEISHPMAVSGIGGAQDQ